MKILFILLTALILRLIHLNQSLWLDEAINVVYSQKYNLVDFLTVYSLGDFHPPLYFGILWIWTRIFGISEIAVRVPSVILGVATVGVTYLIGKQLFNLKTGLIAAAILAFNPLHVYYSQEARMYSLAAFSVTLSFWALINALNGKKYFTFIYGLSIALVLYSDYLVYFAVVAQLIYVLIYEKQKLFKILQGMLLGGIIWAPWLLIFPKQLSTGQVAASQIPGWAGVVGGANIKELALLVVKSIIGRVGFENKFLYAGVVAPVVFLYALISFKAVKELSKELKLILLWILVPVFLAFAISFYLPIFAYFRMIFILPAMALLISFGITKFSQKYQYIGISLILMISFLFLSLYYLNPGFRRENWKDAIAYVKERQSFVYFEDSNIPAPAQYYGCDINCFPALYKFPAAREEDLENFRILADYPGRVYLFDYLVEISDPDRLVSKELEKAGFKNTETKNFNGVGFIYEYSK